jgi:hypothetical protein
MKNEVTVERCVRPECQDLDPDTYESIHADTWFNWLHRLLLGPDDWGAHFPKR